MLLLGLSCVMLIAVGLALGLAALATRSRGLATATAVCCAAGVPLAAVFANERSGFGYGALALLAAGVSLGVLGAARARVAAQVASSALVAAAVAATFAWRDNPWRAHDVCFEEDLPGATDRFRVFNAVSCSSGHALASPSIGADHAVLDFEDLDGDGTDELLVMESAVACGLTAGWCPCVQTVQVFRLVLAPEPHVERAGERAGRQLDAPDC
ncbi:MAG: hypothetical protein JNK82_24570 [Myxococcaceae bacterium]|nr:hypothetical protein [Myxococcaceae bacterium]